MKVVCRKSDGKITVFLREGEPNFDPATEIAFTVTAPPDMENQVWNGSLGLRTKSQAEKDAEEDEKKDNLVSLNDDLLRAFMILSLEVWNGRTPPANVTELRQALRSKL